MWITQFDPKSYRSILKWGEPTVFYHPPAALIELLRERLGLTDEEMAQPYQPGLETVSLNHRHCRLSPNHLAAIQEIVGEQNLATDEYSRAAYTYGKTCLDLLRLRRGELPAPADAVVYPRHEADVERLVQFCQGEGIALVPVGGRTSVTQALECPWPGLRVDLTRHLNRVLEIREIDHTVRVQPGIFGPALEAQLNQCHSPTAPQGYTCGHFPQSFEFSTVGGWVATRGAGQESTGFGKIEEIVVAQRWVTPLGMLASEAYPACALGPDLDSLFIGCEGIYGVLTEATLRIRKRWPPRDFSFLFRTWPEAVEASRRLLQEGIGVPSMLRLSDAQETEIGLRVHRVAGSFSDTLLTALGYRRDQRCLMIGSVESEKAVAQCLVRKVKEIVRHYGGLSLGGKVVQSWRRGRFLDPYLREDLMDWHILTDTLETVASWSNLMEVWQTVRQTIQSRPQTLCLAHISHFYETGANLYFIFLSKMKKDDEIEDYLAFQRQVIEAIRRAGGALSHHHGIGRLFAPWLPAQIGPVGMRILGAIKSEVDSCGILNPGAILANKPTTPQLC